MLIIILRLTYLNGSYYPPGFFFFTINSENYQNLKYIPYESIIYFLIIPILETNDYHGQINNS